STFTCYAKSRNFLSGRFGWCGNRVKGFRLTFRETEHVLKCLPIATTAIAGNRVFLHVKHGVVDLETGVSKSERVLKTRQRFAPINGPVANDPNNQAARPRLFIERRRDLLDRKMVSIIVP